MVRREEHRRDGVRRRAILLGRLLVIVPWAALAVAPISAASGLALLAGSLATFLGYPLTLGVAAVIFAAAAAVVGFSPLRTARHEDAARLDS
ncbi:hypothetical protein [Microbacterium sp. AK031]|uniref:hypothetical protein n=1 Tax=Microbacterium sp. AK031 TaxID=2723076 RepID=UPI00216756A8|nr:hypothetical protein [Microbacterium sp. AK031]MCS3842459.1 hypothetical protein [Microbacterium sp. AK031]